VLGELRQGAVEGLMVEAVAQAAGASIGDLRRAVMVSGDLGAVAQAALTEGGHGLAALTIQLFRPLKPMLAQIAEDVGEALMRLGKAAFEYKLDGARIQLHKQGTEVRIFTRHLNEVTAAVPEIAQAIRDVAARSLILDGEALGVQGDGTPQPFQVTMRRFGRKLDVDRLRRSIPLRPFFFDCLYSDGEAILDRPNAERAAALASAVPEGLLIPRRVIDEKAEAEAFALAAVAAGHEGTWRRLWTRPMRPAHAAVLGSRSRQR